MPESGPPPPAQARSPFTVHRPPWNGFFIVHKPVGPSSAAVVGRIKYLLLQTGIPNKGPGRLVIGHGGTLDPLASGVLPIGVGKATKQLQNLLEGPKTYQFTVTFGIQTTTDDAEGTPISTRNQPMFSRQIETVLPQFTGPILQTPPAFSALKINGKRAYERARAGESVTMEPRTVTIHRLKMLKTDEKSATFEAEVSKGTYIRSLGRDIALALGTVGHISMLCRTKHGPFTLQEAISLETLDKALKSGDITPHLRPLAESPEAQG